MASAKAINLKVRPLQSVDLCFQVDGIVGAQSDIHLLGKSVTKFDLPGLYVSLGQPQGAGSPGRLKFDSQAIHDAVQASLLYELRAEPVKSALDKAIAQRQNSFLQKYNNQAGVIAQMQLIYGNSPTAKAARLAALASISQQQRDALFNEYVNDSRTAVVKKTTSDTTTDGTDSSTADSTSNSNSTGGSTSTGSSGSGSTTTPSTGKSSTTDQSSGSSHTNNTSKSHSSAHTDNVGYDYRHPTFENDAQYQRAQVSLLDEQFSQFMFSQNLPFLDTVFNNELKAIDLDVKRLQVSYLDTLLLSPIDGVVTGVFRDLGDCVRAGQPVMRVENDAEVLLVGTVKFRGLVAIGSNVSLTTKIYDTPTTLSTTGKVVSVRGHDSEDEEWDVLVLCPNRDVHGNPLFPINYNFDFDDTDIDIT
jgi:hypothetical protein